MKVVCLDLEGVLMPEIWEKVAEETGVEELNLTTKEVSEYEELMEHRFEHLRRNEIKINEIRDIVSGIDPLPGATEFLNWLRGRTQVSILTGSFYQFLLPLVGDFDWPFIMARNLSWDDNGYLVDYSPRNRDIKAEAVKTFKERGLKTIGVGDSYNDLRMLSESHKGILFRPAEKVKNSSPNFPVARDYGSLKEEIDSFLNSEK